MTRLEAHQGIYLHSYGLLSRGAIIIGLLWVSILAFMIDRDLRRAMAFSFFAFRLSAVGLIHAEQIGLSLSPVTPGCLVLIALLSVFHLLQTRQTVAS